MVEMDRRNRALGGRSRPSMVPQDAGVVPTAELMPMVQPPAMGQAPPMQPVQVPGPPAGRERGTVSRWTERGFGFITPQDGGDDLFCHFSNIEDGNSLEPGTVVEFVKIYDDRKGKERSEQVSGAGVARHGRGGRRQGGDGRR